jgi:bifunctional non-homologous end joining protein LigD
VERTFKKKDASLLVFEAPQVVSRFEKIGDLFAPVLTLKQRLPDLRKVAGGAKEAQPMEVAPRTDEDSAPPRRAARKKKPGSNKPVREKPGKV